jgi:aminoglycoside 3-N-acetyltransferase
MARKTSLPLFSEGTLRNLLVNELGVQAGDVVFVHSSVNNLYLAFPFFWVLDILQEVVGKEGTVLFPTYPKFSSYSYLLKGEVFDVKKTPSYTGALTELARRRRDSIRSLHPTKSVCAIGPHAKSLTESHQNSPYPYDRCSPYYKLKDQQGAKIIGLGVSTHNLSFVHCVDDALKEKFPVEPYYKTLFHSRCVDYEGNTQIVKTFAHDMVKIKHNIPSYMRSYIPKNICNELTTMGRRFFTVKAAALFDLMLDLAVNRVTIYPKASYKKGQ